jgi:hypothetical protein
MALLRLTIRQLLLSAWRATTHEARDDDTKRSSSTPAMKSTTSFPSAPGDNRRNAAANQAKDGKNRHSYLLLSTRPRPDDSASLCRCRLSTQR